MATYDLYNNINESSLSSAANELISKLNNNKASLDNFKVGLTEGIWKANAKETLLNAFTRINSEIYSDLINQLNKMNRAAELIKMYKNNQNDILTNKKPKLRQIKSELNSLTITEERKAKLKRDIINLEASIKACEHRMEQAENAIKGLCN